jgi:hypothetical protein
LEAKNHELLMVIDSLNAQLASVIGEKQRMEFDTQQHLRIMQEETHAQAMRQQEDLQVLTQRMLESTTNQLAQSSTGHGAQWKSLTQVKEEKQKPIKLHFKDLQRRRVILATTLGASISCVVKFYITMPQQDVFHLEIKSRGANKVAAYRFGLHELLERRNQLHVSFELDQFTLSVEETIKLLCEHFCI